MCQFCVEHGEGKRWYLQAQNYAYDLNSDLVRRDFMIDFVQNFPKMRKTAILGMDMLQWTPAPLRRSVYNTLIKNQKANHYGQPLSIEDCGEVFDVATSITRIPCVCRLNAPGKKGDEVCLLVTHTPMKPLISEAFSGYGDGPDISDFDTISKDEAMGILRTCEENGLMHSIWTFKTPFTAAICNCNVESGCLAMKMTCEYDLKIMFRGEDVAHIDTEKCTHCTRCVKICPFGALSVSERRVTLDQTKCYGCGICRGVCQFGAMSLSDRRTVPLVADLW